MKDIIIVTVSENFARSYFDVVEAILHTKSTN